MAPKSPKRRPRQTIRLRINARIAEGARGNAPPFGFTLFNFDLGKIQLEMRRTLAGIQFSFVGTISPDRDEEGEVIKEFPQSRYSNAKNLPLHRYGAGPFCRFLVADGWLGSGIYALMKGDETLYIGQCKDLKERWGTRGYGRIQPRNCYQGGQETNCRINNLIYLENKARAELTLWFHSIDGEEQSRAAIETSLIASIRTIWNR